MNAGDMTKLAGNFKEISGRLKKINITTASPSGHLKIIMNGQQEVLAVRINPAVLKVHNIGGIEHELAKLFNNALHQSKETAFNEIQKVTGINMEEYKQMF